MKDLPDTDIRMIPLDQLYLHAFNPRQVATEDQIEAKASSMATTVGLMENLLAYEDPARDGLGIVGGGLRLRGLQKLAEEGWGRHVDQARIDPVPVRVTSDAGVARAWALGENVSQEPLTPVQEMRAYRAMADEVGATAEIIARAFGKPARHVARRLALASLPEPAVEALEAGRISLDVARTLTLARSETQFDAALKAAAEEGQNEWQVRRMLTSEGVTAEDHRARYVGMTAYHEAGGMSTEDLFADSFVLHDPEILDTLFRDKLTNAAERVKEEEGWAKVEPIFDETYVGYWITDKMTRLYPTPVDLPEAEFEELAELEEIGFEGLSDEGQARLVELKARAQGDFTDADREAGTVYVCVTRQGELEVSRAWTKKEKRASAGDKAGGAEGKPAIPAAVGEDLQRLRLAALQGALSDKSDLMLDLLAYQLEARFPVWKAPLGIQVSYGDITPIEGDGTRINSHIAAINSGANHDAISTWVGFEAFRDKGKKYRNATLALHLARTLTGFGHHSMVKEIEDQMQTGLRQVWTPTAANFFKRVKADYLDAIWAELLGLKEGDEQLAEFAKLKKGEKVKELDALFNDTGAQEALGLSRDQIAAIDAWVPGIVKSEN